MLWWPTRIRGRWGGLGVHQLSQNYLEDPFRFGKDTTEGENTRFGVGPTQKGVFFFSFGEVQIVVAVSV